MRPPTTARALVAALALAGIAGGPAWAGSAVALDDAELDLVVAGEAPDAEGDPAVRTTVFQTTQTISGPVQQGASSMISVFALNSAVNAQLNLIVGDVGHATQVNAGAVGQSMTLR